MLALLAVACAAPAPSSDRSRDDRDETLVINYVMGLKSVLPAPKPLGATHVILGFIEPKTTSLPDSDSVGVHSWFRGAVAEYAKLSLMERRELREQLGTKNKPAKLMASVGGPDIKHDDYHWPTFDPDAFGKTLADSVVKLGLDGVDIDLEGWSRWVGVDKKHGAPGSEQATGDANLRFQNRDGTHYIATPHTGVREGNNIGIKEANWVVDTNGPNFVKRLTLAIRKRFQSEFSFLRDQEKTTKDAEQYHPSRFYLSHASRLPDFHKGKTYERLLGDADFFDAVDFFNVQFYNQFVFDTNAHIFTKDIYPAQEGAPTCLASIVNATVQISAGKRRPEEVSAKLVLGFPCIGGSFQIDDYNHNECDAKRAADVVATGLTLGYPLRGVFEMSAHPPQVYPELLTTWNAIIRAALQNKTLPQFGETSPLVWVNNQKSSDGVACHTLAPPSSHIDDGWCIRSCARDYCPKDICSDECRPAAATSESKLGGANGSVAAPPPEGPQDPQGAKELPLPPSPQEQQQERAERLRKNRDQCHSIASAGSGIEDSWCIDTCSQGSCSAEYCSMGCRALDPASGAQAPELKRSQASRSAVHTARAQEEQRRRQRQQQQEQQANALAAQGDDECFTVAPAESHIDDEWCVNSCVRNYCPEDLCSKGCTQPPGAGGAGEAGEAAGEAAAPPREAEALREDGECHSVVGLEKGIDDKWCVTSCLQGICPDEFCSRDCLSLKYRLRRGFLSPASRPLPAASPLPSPSPSPATVGSPAASPEAIPALAPFASFAAAEDLPPRRPDFRPGDFLPKRGLEAGDILEARRQGELREARVLGWNQHGGTMTTGGTMNPKETPRDRSPHCDSWAAGGECAKNPAFMLAECALACRLHASLSIAASDAHVLRDTNGSSALSSASAPASNATLMDRYMAEEGLAPSASLAEHAAAASLAAAAKEGAAGSRQEALDSLAAPASSAEGLLRSNGDGR